MLKRFLLLITLGYSTFGFSEDPASLRILDFSKMQVADIPGYRDLNYAALAEEFSLFDGGSELCAYLHYLKEAFHLDIAVETGTGIGNTVGILGNLFDEVHTMEIDVALFQKSLSTLSSYPHIKVHYGNSPDILRQILPRLKNKRPLFYLDANASTKWPFLEEIDLIGTSHHDNCIIVINGIKVPGRSEIPCYTHARGDCSYDYIKARLDQVFTNHYHYYVIPKSANAHAKLVVIPKKRAFASG